MLTCDVRTYWIGLVSLRFYWMIYLRDCDVTLTTRIAVLLLFKNNAANTSHIDKF